MSEWVIVGAGYTGARLAKVLRQQGHGVTVTRRHLRDALEVAEYAGGARAFAVDLVDPRSLDAALVPGAVVVDSVPPVATEAAEANLVRRVSAARARRLVYLGSTGVYPGGAGLRVDENTPPAPISERGRARLAAETTVLETARACGLSAVVLRSAAIYGPGRGVQARLAAGTYRIVGAGDTLVSRIHVDDLISAIIAVGNTPTLEHEIFNVADDDPTTSRELGDEVARLLQLPSPQSVDPAAVSASVRSMLGADRRICNERLKSLGVELRYPSWREGIPAAIVATDGGVGARRE